MSRVFATIGAGCLLLAACGGVAGWRWRSGGGGRGAPNVPDVPPPVACDDSIEFCGIIQMVVSMKIIRTQIAVISMLALLTTACTEDSE